MCFSSRNNYKKKKQITVEMKINAFSVCRTEISRQALVDKPAPNKEKQIKIDQNQTKETSKLPSICFKA